MSRIIRLLLVMALATMTCLVGVGRGVASPVPSWTGSGAEGSVVADGSVSAPQFRYDVPTAGLSVLHTWTFTTTAASTGTVTLPYDYRGTHEYFHVTVQVDAIVIHNGVTTTTSVLRYGPVDCCTSPSAGFAFSGTKDFAVAAGDTYGFRFGGSNFDSNNQLHGTFTVPITGYTDAGPVAENTSWTTAALLTTAGATGVLTQSGEARWYKFPIVPSSQIQVTLSRLAQNYDLTLYSDIGAAFTTLTSTTDLNTLGAEQSGNAYSPSIYSPSIYSPSIYSPSIYSPSIYSPSIYSPSIYSPSIYSPSIYSPSIYSPSIYSP